MAALRTVSDISQAVFGAALPPVGWEWSQGEMTVASGLNGAPARFGTGDLLGNVLVEGRPGSWKTTLLATIRRQLIRLGVRTMWLDVYKKDGRHEPGVRVFRVARGELKVNPLQLSTHLFCDIFDEAFQLPSASRSSAHLARWVEELLTRKPAGNLFDLRHYLRSLRLGHRSYEDEARDVISSRLGMILDGQEGRCFDCAEGYPPAALLEHDIVMELPPSQARACFISQCVLWSVMEHRIRGPRVHGLTNVVLVDEAKTLFSAASRSSRYTGHLEMLTAAINICREYGIAMIWADQSAEAIHQALIESSAIKVLLPSSGEVIQRLARNLELTTPERVETAMRLEPGQALLKCGSRPTVLVKLAKSVYEKNVSDADLDASFSPLPHVPATYDEWKAAEADADGGFAKLRARFWGLYARSGGILNLSEMASRLKTSMSEMSKMAARLQEDGHVEKRRFMTRQKLLEATPAGERWCAGGGWFITRKGRGGVVHRRHQYLIGRAMQRKGARVEIEGENFDVLAHFNGRRVGFEIITETSGPDVTVHLRKANAVDELVFIFESGRGIDVLKESLAARAANVRVLPAVEFYKLEGIEPFVKLQ